MPFLRIVSSIGLPAPKAAVAIATAAIAAATTMLEGLAVPIVLPLQGQPHFTLLQLVQPRLCLQQWLKQ